MKIRNLISHPRFTIGDKVKYEFNTTGIEGYYYGTITRLLCEFDNYTGKHYPMVQLNNDEFHTYYTKYVEML